MDAESQAASAGSRRPPDAGEICALLFDGQKNDFRDAEAIAEAVQRPTMKFVATKTGEQLDLQALHRVRERLVGQHTGVVNQMRAFLLERGVAVRQGLRFLRTELPIVSAQRSDVLSPHAAPFRAAARWLQLNKTRSPTGADQRR
jgi:transposase